MRLFLAAFSISLLLGLEAQASEIGDRERGEQLFEVCAHCHEVGPGAVDGIGPNLNGIFGRRAGSVEDYEYSEGLARMGTDGVVWTLETLDIYIENPRAFVSRTRMAFPGLDDPQDRADVLAYLRDFSDNPRDIPEAEPTARPERYAVAPEVLEIVGDREYGAYLSSECRTCHQESGASEGIPDITQWPTEHFVLAMHAYRDGVRPHPVMQMIASRLGDEEIAALAAYFATLGE